MSPRDPTWMLKELAQLLKLALLLVQPLVLQVHAKQGLPGGLHLRLAEYAKRQSVESRPGVVWARARHRLGRLDGLAKRAGHRDGTADWARPQPSRRR